MTFCFSLEAIKRVAMSLWSAAFDRLTSRKRHEVSTRPWNSSVKKSVKYCFLPNKWQSRTPILRLIMSLTWTPARKRSTMRQPNRLFKVCSMASMEPFSRTDRPHLVRLILCKGRTLRTSSCRESFLVW